MNKSIILLHRLQSQVDTTSLSLTSSEGRNRRSFSTTITLLGLAFKIDRVNVPGPGPTSHTRLPGDTPANLTILSFKNQINT